MYRHSNHPRPQATVWLAANPDTVPRVKSPGEWAAEDYAATIGEQSHDDVFASDADADWYERTLDIA